MYWSGFVRRVAVTSDGRTEVLMSDRTVIMADGVNGAFMDRRESLVVCDFRALAEADRRGSGDCFSDVVDSEAAAAGEERDDLN